MVNIIVLNGTSSSGKSTLAKALQNRLEEPYLHAGIDHYIFMLPKRYLNPPLWSEIFRYEYASDGSIARIHTGSRGQQLISGMHHAIRGLADAGFHVIVDHVIMESAWLDEMKQLFSAHHMHFVGVMCPLEILEQREKNRRDRTLGQARAQYDSVHIHGLYDLQVDTSQASPEEAAAQIHGWLLQQPA